MFNTAAAALLIIGFVLPGFLVATIANSLRASTGTESDWALVLRALSYAIVIHVVFLWWTACLAQRTDNGHEWSNHVLFVIAYATTVLLAVPFALGLLLNWYLRSAEDRGSLKPWHYALGAADARDAWDYVFQRTRHESFMFVRTDKELVAGRFTQSSWAGKTPSPHDLYLEEVWLFDKETGIILEPMQPRYGVWFAADTIKDVYFATDPADLGGNVG